MDDAENAVKILVWLVLFVLFVRFGSERDPITLGWRFSITRALANVLLICGALLIIAFSLVCLGAVFFGIFYLISLVR